MIVTIETLEPKFDWQSQLISLRQAGSRIVSPREEQSVSDFCESNIRLSPLWEATPGIYDVQSNPFFRDILDAFTDREVYQISLPKSTQIGGTLALIASIMAMSEIDPSPGMLVCPDRINVIETRDRLYDNARESKLFIDRVPHVRDWNERHIDLRSTRVYLAWSGSPQRLRGRACKRVWRTEIDVYKKTINQVGGDPLAASAERTKRFFWSQIYNESSPHGDNSPIWAFYEDSNQQKWMCPCSKCGKHQELRFYVHKETQAGGFVGYTDKEGNLKSKDDAIRDVRYKCESGCILTNQQIKAMVLKGKWVPKGQYVDDKTGEIKGKPLRSRRHLGFHLWSIHSPMISLGKIAEAFIDHKIKNKVREFFENWLGLRYRTSRKVPKWRTLGERLRWHYPRLTVPLDAWFITAGGDVQLDGVHYVIRAWGHMGTSWLIDTGFLPRYRGSETGESSIDYDLQQFEFAVMRRRFSMQDGERNKFGNETMRVLLAGLDGNYRTRDVHNYWSMRGQGTNDNRLRIVRGDDKVDPADRFRMTLVEKPQRGGEAYAGGGLELWRIYSISYKEDLLARYNIEPGQPGAFHFPSDIFQFGEDYLRQIVNEVPQDVIDKNGKKKSEWQVIQPSIGNHRFDSEVYCAASAEMYLASKGLTWDLEKWQTSEQEQAAMEAKINASQDWHRNGVEVRARDHM